MADLFTPPDNQPAITVSELNRQARTLLERGLARLWVEGELSNLARPASGHLYFTLKDASAQIRCAFFRQRQRGPTIGFADGDRMQVYGRVSLYEARGDYQLIVERLEPAGEGELRRQFELLKKKLAAEGLFDDDLKRPLPTLPRCVGIITSPSGAAVRDVLTVMRRRFPAVPVIVYPAAVQGDAAVPELLAALERANRRAECDVLIMGRGGGSLEDLWAFNDETLARAIRASGIPVVSAVGHEVDFTIADFVADLRAPTPTAAGEMVVPDQAQWQLGLQTAARRLATEIRRLLDEQAQSIDWLARRLARGSPAAAVVRQTERLRNARARLALAVRHDLDRRARRAEQLKARLVGLSPAARLQRNAWQLDQCRERLLRAVRDGLRSRQEQLTLAARGLHGVSPLATLDRGYAIVSDAGSGELLRDAAKVASGRRIRARLAQGSLVATVDSSHAKAGDDDA